MHMPVSQIAKRWAFKTITQNLTKANIFFYCIFLFPSSLGINGYLCLAIPTSLCPLLLRRGSLTKNDLTAIPALLFRKGFSVYPDTFQAEATSQALKPTFNLRQCHSNLYPVLCAQSAQPGFS